MEKKGYIEEIINILYIIDRLNVKEIDMSFNPRMLDESRRFYFYL